MSQLQPRRSRWVKVATLLVLLGFPRATRAQTAAPLPAAPEEPAAGAPAPPTPAASAPATPAGVPDKLEHAKELFRRGNELRAAGDFEGALEMYLASRSEVPSVANTLNAALTLDRLGRNDEAMEMYEQLLTRFPDLEDKDRRAIGPAMRALRAKLGSLDISSNVDGVLLVDGRQRGKLPLTSPVAVLPGRHVVRVLKDGYDAFEATVDVKLRQKLLVEARLKRLSHIGKLRVDEPELRGAELFIDGGKVGTLPWEGALAPGQHRYVVRKGDVGSAPKPAIVVEGQTVLAEVKWGALSRELRLSVEPSTADLFIDSVPVGKGQWQGRLPLGRYQIEAREVGYRSERRSLEASGDRGRTTSFKLRIDPESPRWGQSEPGKPWVELFAGLAIASSLGSDMEAACDRGACSSRGIAAGPLVGARGGWQFPIGASIEVGAGYASLSRKLARHHGDTYDGGQGAVAVTYAYTDKIHFRGPFLLAGIGYPVALSERIALGLRVDVGVVFAGVSDDLGARATALGRTVPAEVENSGKTVRSAVVFADPEVGITMSFGALHAGFGLGALIFPVTGPKLETGDTRVSGTNQCDPAPPPPGQQRPVECAKNSGVVAGERGFSSFVAWVPSVLVGYTF